jgi:hypothetical protein
MTDEKKDKRVIPDVSDLNDEGLDSVFEEPEGGERTQETKPPVKKPSPKKEDGQGGMHVEDSSPDIAEQIRRFDKAELPACPFCGSKDTASVQVGMVGRALTIAASTTKVKLVPNAKDKLGNYFCNACKKYFN